MRIKIITIITIISMFVVSLYNADFLPPRQEISNMEIVTIAGMDKKDNGYEMSIYRTKKNGGTSATSGSEETEQEVFTVDSIGYNLNIKYMQTITDKHILSSHIKYYIIGEDTAKTDFYHIIDTIARGNQTRLTSKIYVVKGMTAKEFLEKSASENVKLEERLTTLEEGFWSQVNENKAEIRQIAKMLFKPNGVTLIPAISYTLDKSGDIKEVEEYRGENEEDETRIPFDFVGFAIAKDMQVVDFLEEKQSLVANYILESNTITEINVEKDDTMISFGIENLNVNVKFEFNNDRLSKVILDAKCKSNYEEVKSTENVFSLNNIKEFENNLEQIIGTQLRDIVDLSQKKDIDFFNFEEMLERKHPYKYRKIKDSFWEQFKEASLVINVKVDVQTTYDIIQSNWLQKGNEK